MVMSCLVRGRRCQRRALPRAPPPTPTPLEPVQQSNLCNKGGERSEFNRPVTRWRAIDRLALRWRKHLDSHDQALGTDAVMSHNAWLGDHDCAEQAKRHTEKNRCQRCHTGHVAPVGGDGKVYGRRSAAHNTASPPYHLRSDSAPAAQG